MYIKYIFYIIYEREKERIKERNEIKYLGYQTERLFYQLKYAYIFLSEDSHPRSVENTLKRLLLLLNTGQKVDCE